MNEVDYKIGMRDNDLMILILHTFLPIKNFCILFNFNYEAISIFFFVKLLEGFNDIFKVSRLFSFIFSFSYFYFFPLTDTVLFLFLSLNSKLLKP